MASYSSPRAQAYKTALETSKLKKDQQIEKLKLQVGIGEKFPTKEDRQGDTLIEGAKSMSNNPHKNVWTGLLEGLMRGFGGALKGKAAEERYQQIENILEATDYAIQGKEYANQIKSDLTERRAQIEKMPSETQYLDAINTGTLEPTIQTLLKQNGMDPNNVTLSKDNMTIFMDNGNGQIEKIPVQTLFNPQESKDFGFTNSLIKENLAKSGNQQIQGIAQENVALQSKVAALTQQLKKVVGDEDVAAMLAQEAIQGEEMQEKKMRNETTIADARQVSSIASRDRVKLDADLHALKKEKLVEEVSSLKKAKETAPYGTVSLKQVGSRGVSKLIGAALPTIGIADEAPVLQNYIDEAKDIIENSPRLAKTGNLLFIDGKLQFAKGMFMKDEERIALEKLEKIRNRFSEAYIRAKGSNISEGERETIKKSIFGLDQANESMLYNLSTAEKELERQYAKGMFAAEQLSQGNIALPNSFDNYVNENPDTIKQYSSRLKEYAKTLRLPESEEVTIELPDGTITQITKKEFDAKQKAKR